MQYVIINIFFLFVFSLPCFSADAENDLDLDDLFKRPNIESFEEVKKSIATVGKASLQPPITILKRPDLFFQKTEGNTSPKVMGRGGSKIAIELNEERIALLGLSIMLAKEKEAYDIIRRTGLICQQNPLIQRLEGADTVYESVLSVHSFSYLTKDNLTTIYDKKSQKSVGNLKIFGDDPVKNFTDINYNLNLLKPLVRDMALWEFIGSPGSQADSLNLIFHKTKEEGVQCRLFLYDLYDKTASESSNTFHQFSIISRKDFLNFIEDCYTASTFSEMLENNRIIWNKEISQEEWNCLSPMCQESTLYKNNEILLKERAELWKALSSLLFAKFVEEGNVLKQKYELEAYTKSHI